MLDNPVSQGCSCHGYSNLEAALHARHHRQNRARCSCHGYSNLEAVRHRPRDLHQRRSCSCHGYSNLEAVAALSGREVLAGLQLPRLQQS